MKTAAAVFLVAFFFNLMWEHAHYALYDCAAGCAVATLSSLSFLPLLVRASIFDAFFITTLFIALSFLHRSLGWLHNISFADIVGIAIAGLSYATLVERHALTIGKWQYAGNMPIVPLLQVGLTPFIQLALLSLLTYWMIKKFSTA